MPGSNETGGGWPKPRLVVLSGDQHDLPPKWDGVAVEWSEWRQMPLTTARFHGPADTCDCGNSDDTRRVSCDGRVWVEDETARRSTAGRRCVIRFWVSRCVDCHLDTVWDEPSGEVWTLDATDYSDTGSTDPALVSS